MLIKPGKIIDIIQKNLDYVDPRLMSHGKRVAYLVFKMLQLQDKYTEKEVHDICILAMLHDIGAYKTEEIDKMVMFETVNIWEHSIYGYLFLKYFSPLKKLAPVIFFHHADCDDLQYLHPAYHELAQMISLCDRADVYAHTINSDIKGFKELVEKAREKKYRTDIIDMFFKVNSNFDLSDRIINSDKKFRSALYDTPFTEQEVSDYIKMIILSVEFRSRQTAIHTIATTCIAGILAEMCGLSENEIAKITTGAMLHDIGKTGIPVEILENPHQLNDDEMKKMKSHVSITEDIIAGSVSDEVWRIAVRHHEKLNGAGYPRGLNAAELTLSERINAVADIFSALCGARSYKGEYHKEKIVEILDDMSSHGFIDPKITAIATEHFELIMENIYRESAPVIEMYDKINKEFTKLLENVKGLKDGAGFNGLLVGQEFIFA